MSFARWTSLSELAGTVPDGALVAPGGFMLGRAPMALVFELIRQGRRELRVLSLPNPLPAEMLVAAGAAARVEFAFSGLTLGGRVRPMPCLKAAIEAGTLSWAEMDGYRLVQRLRAAAMGLPFLPAPDAQCSELASVDPPAVVVDPFTGNTVPVERPVIPDVALLHAQAADAEGNLFFEDPTTDLLMAGAARRVLATADRRVERLPRVSLPAFQVEAVAEVWGGALPTGSAGLYPHDEADLLEYLSLAAQGSAAQYLARRTGAARTRDAA
ncbi:MAG: CoA transferase subunit A [Myxococcaceae bacterium]